MKIQIGYVCLDKVTGAKIGVPNKTRKYLLPCFKEYGQEFTEKISNVFKVAVGIGDIVIDNAGLKYEKHVFILVNTEIAPDYFINFIDWVREQEMYADDYVYDDIQKSSFHMIVLKLPEKFYGSYESFLKGEYSKMYNEETINSFFSNYPREKKVLIHDHNYKVEFIEKLNKVFDTTISVDEYSGEYELPPNEETDVFNHHLSVRN